MKWLSRALTLFTATALVVAARQAPAAEVETVVREMARELTKKTSDPGGRPLPVVGHWANAFGRDNFSSEYQTELLEKGHHVMPTLPMPRVGTDSYPESGQATVKKLAKWKAPFALRAGQWEQWLLSKDHPRDNPGRWRNLPPEQSPLVLTPEGKLDNWLSPFGAVEPWREVGRYYTSSGAFDQLEQWYPDPPLVILLSNNEARRLEPKHNIETRSKRYLDLYGSDKPKSFQRRVMAEGYLKRYAALFEGIREGLASKHWQQHSLLVAYEGFGPPHFGRWSGWTAYSYSTDEEIDPWHRVWDGSAPSYYTHDWNASTDYRVHSPQIEAMNWVFMLEEVYREKPDFWFELSIWDGNFGSSNNKKRKEKRDHYLQAGQTWSPQRYAGFGQFGLWLTTPRVVREFRASTVKREEFHQDFEALVAAVDRIWQNPTLTRFWRHGKLVPNRSRQHPYQSRIPKKWQSVDRWFLLSTNLDPPGEWNVKTEIPVFSLARVLGEEGSRQWLVFAHSPLKARQGVEIEVPGYGAITVDVTPGGDFYQVEENGRRVTHLQD